MRLYPYDLHINYCAGTMEADKLIFSSSMFNGLFEYDYYTDEIVFKGLFSGENVLKYPLHQKTLKWRDKLLFVPMSAKELCIYDRKTSDFEYVKLHDWSDAVGMDCILDGDNLWIFYTKKAYFAVRIDLISRDVITIKAPDMDVYGFLRKDVKESLYGNVVMEGRYIYLPLWADKAIVRFNKDTCDYELIHIDMEGLRLVTVAVCDRDIFFTSFKDWNVYQYNLDTKRTKIYEGYATGETPKGILYPVITEVMGKVCLLPEVGNNVMTLKDGKVIPLCQLPNDFAVIDNPICKKRRRFYRYEVNGSEITALPYSTNRLLKVNVDTAECTEKELVFDADCIENLFEKVYKPAYIKEQEGKAIVNEGRLYTLKDFINEI